MTSSAGQLSSFTSSAVTRAAVVEAAAAAAGFHSITAAGLHASSLLEPVLLALVEQIRLG